MEQSYVIFLLSKSLPKQKLNLPNDAFHSMSIIPTLQKLSSTSTSQQSSLWKIILCTVVIWEYKQTKFARDVLVDLKWMKGTFYPVWQQLGYELPSLPSENRNLKEKCFMFNYNNDIFHPSVTINLCILCILFLWSSLLLVMTFWLNIYIIVLSSPTHAKHLLRGTDVKKKYHLFLLET